MSRWTICFNAVVIVSVEADRVDQALIRAVRTLCILGLLTEVICRFPCIIIVIKDMQTNTVDSE
ncbi:MAG: hypothetical protein ABFD46_02715 [Armatimonadota bacterium]